MKVFCVGCRLKFESIPEVQIYTNEPELSDISDSAMMCYLTMAYRKCYQLEDKANGVLIVNSYNESFYPFKSFIQFDSLVGLDSLLKALDYELDPETTDLVDQVYTDKAHTKKIYTFTSQIAVDMLLSQYDNYRDATEIIDLIKNHNDMIMQNPNEMEDI